MGNVDPGLALCRVWGWPVEVKRSGTTVVVNGAPHLSLNSRVMTRPEDWAPAARAILWPDRTRALPS